MGKRSVMDNECSTNATRPIGRWLIERTNGWPITRPLNMLVKREGIGTRQMYQKRP
jgi:hypothetical protein